MTAQEHDVHDELRQIADALRQQLEWQQQCGTYGLPAAVVKEPQAVVAPLRVLAPHGPSAADEGATAVRNIAELTSKIGAALPRHTPSAPARTGYEPASATMTPEQRVVELQQLVEQVKACAGCPLHAQRLQAVFARGNPLAELMIIGEGPGADEDAQGEPFVGKAGQLLDRMIVAMGYGRDEVYIANVVKCRPPENRAPTPEEMEVCIPFLHRQIELVSPKVIVAMGATALRGLLGIDGGITRARGKWKMYRAKLPVMPTFHPAYVLRTPTAKRDVWTDLQEVLKVLKRPLPQPQR